MNLTDRILDTVRRKQFDKRKKQNDEKIKIESIRNKLLKDYIKTPINKYEDYN